MRQESNRRRLQALEDLDTAENIEAFCYTPEELAIKSSEIGIVSEALKEGIVVHG